MKTMPKPSGTTLGWQNTSAAVNNRGMSMRWPRKRTRSVSPWSATWARRRST